MTGNELYLMKGTGKLRLSLHSWMFGMTVGIRIMREVVLYRLLHVKCLRL